MERDKKDDKKQKKEEKDNKGSETDKGAFAYKEYRRKNLSKQPVTELLPPSTEYRVQVPSVTSQLTP
jgi:hypothetical protein